MGLAKNLTDLQKKMLGGGKLRQILVLALGEAKPLSGNCDASDRDG